MRHAAWVGAVVLAAGLAPAGARPAAAADPTTAPVVAATPPAPVISDREAAAHVGEEVTVEGRVHAVHVSQLATVLAFAPSYAGFTATIHAADRDRFPADVAERAQNQLVRVRGTVTSYRGRAEMTLRHPSQITIVGATATAPAADAPAADPTAAGTVPDDVRDTLVRIEARLDAIERHIGRLESAPAPAAAEAPALLVLGVGMAADEVRAQLGDPSGIRVDPDGTQVWAYGPGRLVRLDPTGRVIDWQGF